MNLQSASEAERQAERLKRDLAVTLDRIVDNLAPANLASEAMAAAQEHTPDWLRRYWTFAKSPAGLAVVGGALGVGLAGLIATRRRVGRHRR